MLTQNTVITRLHAVSEEIQKLVANLTPEQKETIKIYPNWTVKDIIAHLAGWNWEAIEEIKRILKNETTWHELFIYREKVDTFNSKNVEKVKHLKFEKVMEKYLESVEALIEYVKNLSNEQWQFTSDKIWQYGSLKGTSVSVWSIFDYGELSHEARHIADIKKLLSK